eukprot:TRINITY_DN26761_c0_g1_i1.p1 TRINITY_DN26761_c0_g1~~TRINITY_DN26761_c0_g1_i1.p1  ORF type:complete len:195 (+),score=43.74 TRINITY_DN26761_c0_g1_i1:76-660(+)
MDPYNTRGHTGEYTHVSQMSVMELKHIVNRLYDSDPLSMKRVVDDVITELGQARAELAKQDDVLQSLTFDLVEAQKEAERLHNFVNIDILGREYRAQGAPMSSLSPTPPTSGCVRGALDPKPFDPYHFQDTVAAHLTAAPEALYRVLADVESAAQWAQTVIAFEKHHPKSCLTTLVISACPQAKDLLRSRGIVF